MAPAYSRMLGEPLVLVGASTAFNMTGGLIGALGCEQGCGGSLSGRGSL